MTGFVRRAHVNRGRRAHVNRVRRAHVNRGRRAHVNRGRRAHVNRERDHQSQFCHVSALVRHRAVSSSSRMLSLFEMIYKWHEQ